MKKSELKVIIKEEIKKILSERKYEYNVNNPELKNHKKYGEYSDYITDEEIEKMNVISVSGSDWNGGGRTTILSVNPLPKSVFDRIDKKIKEDGQFQIKIHYEKKNEKVTKYHNVTYVNQIMFNNYVGD